MHTITKISLSIVFGLLFLLSPLSSQPVFAQSASDCAIINVGKPPTNAPIPVDCIDAIAGSAQDLARQILSNPRIKLLNSSRKDIVAVRDGKNIRNSDSCGNTVTVHPALLKVILQLGQKHTYDIWNIITEHGCDQYYHPRGRAMDIGRADGRNSWQNASFRQDAADVLPSGSTLLQTYCPGTPQVIPRRKLIQGDDGCTHQHIDVGIDIPNAKLF